jgi:hypothetical protein
MGTWTGTRCTAAGVYAHVGAGPAGINNNDEDDTLAMRQTAGVQEQAEAVRRGDAGEANTMLSHVLEIVSWADVIEAIAAFSRRRSGAQCHAAAAREDPDLTMTPLIRERRASCCLGPSLRGHRRAAGAAGQRRHRRASRAKYPVPQTWPYDMFGQWRPP